MSHRHTGRKSPRTLPRLALLVGASLAIATSSWGQAEPAATERPEAKESSDPPLPPGTARRTPPDYRGRPRAPSPGEQALWVPRVMLAPVYVLSHLVAQPLVALGRYAEQHHWHEHIHDFFTFGPEQRMGLFPSGWVDSGFKPSVGLHFFWHAPRHSSDFSLRATTGGADWWSVNARWQLPVGADRLTLVERFSRRTDAAFHGLGPDSPPDVARYGEQALGTRVEYRMPLGAPLSLTTLVVQEWRAFEPSVATGDEVSLARAVQAGQLAAPPALDGGLLTVGTGLRLDFDPRRGRLLRLPRREADFAHVSGSGVAAHALVLQQVGLQRTRAAAGDTARWPAWLRIESSVTGTLDLTGTQRRVELELYTAFTDPLPGAGEVPFTEQVSLGGSRQLPGFGSGRLIDRSAGVATLRYRWPIWSELDGTLHYAVGNVFGPHLRGLSLAASRSSFGLGVATASNSDQVFELLLAFGTEVFGEGGEIENARWAAGTRVTF